MKILHIVAEYIHGKLEKLTSRKSTPSLLSMAVVTFTEESWLGGINRQGRLMEHLYYYN